MSERIIIKAIEDTCQSGRKAWDVYEDWLDIVLAAASVCPRWAIDYNVVRFFGQDIDRTCVKMARVNMMLYGLNGYGLRLNAALHAPPAELVTAVTLAKPDQDAPPEPTITLPSGRAEQGSLFV